MKANGVTHYLARAVDHEGEALETVITKTRDCKAALKDRGQSEDREIGRCLNIRADNSHLPFRRQERVMLRFRQMRRLQKFVSVHASHHNNFPTERHLQNRAHFKQSRAAALAVWRSLVAA